MLNCSFVSNSLWPHGLQPARLLCPWDSPGKNTGVGCHALLHGIFPTQGSNPGLPHCRQILYQLSHQGSPRILEYPIPWPGDLPNPGIEPLSPALQADSLPQLSYHVSLCSEARLNTLNLDLMTSHWLLEKRQIFLIYHSTPITIQLQLTFPDSLPMCLFKFNKYLSNAKCHVRR